MLLNIRGLWVWNASDGPTFIDRRPAASPSRENWIGDLARMLAVDTTFPPGTGYSHSPS